MNTSKPEKNHITIEESLEQNGYFIYTNVGSSMMPFLRHRKDIIEIRKKENERCKRYDIVLYKHANQYILHRVLRVLPDGKYIIAGDNNTFLEKDITDDHILGVVTQVIRNGKTIKMDDWRYLTYVHLWSDFYPIRKGILKTKVLLHNLKKRLV